MSEVKSSLSVAGDVNIEQIEIVTSRGFIQDIKPQVVAIELFEDIFSTFITGKIYVRDSQEFTNLLPLIGEEYVRLSVITPTLDPIHAYKGEFFIYKMDDRVRMAERDLAFVLHFISKEAILDMNKKISKAYGGKVSDIIKVLIENEYGLQSKKTPNIEETKNETKFVSNWWRPTQCIQFAVETAVNKNNSPSYVFFENKYGLNFVSLETLYTEPPIKQTFIWDQYTREISSASHSAIRDINKDYQRIIELETPQSFNYFTRLSSGMYGSELVTYDIVTKQYVHVAYTPANDKDIKHLNQYPLWTDKTPKQTKAVMIYGSKYFNNFEGFSDVTNTKCIQKRKAIIAAADAHKLNITVLGRTDYSVGQRITLSVPKNTQIKPKDDPEDKILSGNYLISAINHMITRENHKCAIELIKDSYIVDINK